MDGLRGRLRALVTPNHDPGARFRVLSLPAHTMHAGFESILYTSVVLKEGAAAPTTDKPKDFAA